MTGHIIEFVTRQRLHALDVVIEVDLETTCRIPHVEAIISKCTTAEHLLLKLYGLLLVARESLKGGYTAEQFSTLPDIAFIKTEDIVANPDIRTPFNHMSRPVDNELFFRITAMNDDTRDIRADFFFGRVDKAVSLRRLACAYKNHTDLNNRILQLLRNRKIAIWAVTLYIPRSQESRSRLSRTLRRFLNIRIVATDNGLLRIIAFNIEFNPATRFNVLSVKETQKRVEIRLIHFKAASLVMKDGNHLFIKKELPGLSKEVKAIHADFHHWKLTVCSVPKESLALDFLELDDDIGCALFASRFQNLSDYRLNISKCGSIRKFNIEGGAESSNIYMNLGTCLRDSKEFNLEFTSHIIVIFHTGRICVSVRLFSFAHMPRRSVLALDF